MTRYKVENQTLFLEEPLYYSYRRRFGIWFFLTARESEEEAWADCKKEHSTNPWGLRLSLAPDFLYTVFIYKVVIYVFILSIVRIFK